MPNVKLKIIKCLQLNEARNLIKIFIKHDLLHLDFNKVIVIEMFHKRSSVINSIYSGQQLSSYN